MSKKIAVIGGGLSGLTTAFYLKQDSPQVQLTLFESSERLGGVIHTEHLATEQGDTFTLDHGADMFATEPPAALQLCRDLGVENELLVPDTANAGAMIVCDGQLAPIPDGFVLMRATKLWPILRSPLLSVSGKLRFLTERWRGKCPVEMTDPSGDMSVANFVRHRLGPEVLERLVGPLVAGIYTADIEKLSMNATMAPLAGLVRKHGSFAKATAVRRREDKDHVERNSAGARYEKFRGFPNGMGQLIETLSDAVGTQSIRTNCAVEAMERTENGWLITSNGVSETFDHVVLATPASVTSRLLETVTDDSVLEFALQAAQGLAAIESASTAIVVLAVPKSQVSRLPSQFGFVVPMREKRKVLAVSFASHKYTQRCPADHTIIRVFVGGSMQPHLLDQTDEALVEMVRDELSDLIGLSGQPTLGKVVRWNNAMPQYHVGHVSRADSIESAVEQIPDLSLATNALRGVGIAPVVARARALADSIATSLLHDEANQKAD